MTTTYFPGTRVLVFDSRRYKDDRATPLHQTLCMATVERWYGKRSERFGLYPSLLDVRFDHTPEKVSRGHLATPDNRVRVVETEEQAESAVREVTTNAQLSPSQENSLRRKLLKGLRP